MTDMQKIGFGGASLSGEAGGYGFGIIDRPGSLVRAAIEYGIEYFDTAPIYGFGNSEEVMGKALKGSRSKVKIINKCGVTWHSTKRVNMTNDPKVACEMLNTSLKRMDCDYFDVYMVHWPDTKVDIRFTLEALIKEQEKGKIIRIGLCNTNQAELDKAKELINIRDFQSEINLFNNGLKSLNVDSDFKMGWGTFDKGILAGSIKEDTVFSREDARSWAPWWKKSNWKEKCRFVSYVEQKYNLQIKNYALKYSLDVCDLTLIGFKKPSHIEEVATLKNLDLEAFDEVCNEFQAFS